MIKYYTRSINDKRHLYKYDDETGEFWWMDHVWDEHGEWVKRDEFPTFELVEIPVEKALAFGKAMKNIKNQ